MLLVTSCCSWCPVVYRDVKVPVAVACPIPPTFEPIIDPVLNFTQSLSIEQKVKDLRASRVMWRDRAKQQEVLLDTYRNRTFGNFTGLK